MDSRRGKCPLCGTEVDVSDNGWPLGHYMGWSRRLCPGFKVAESIKTPPRKPKGIASKQPGKSRRGGAAKR